ncbi:hypothetical protein GALMADRAFT_139661 [Galerina marginata CBS 339.88]|uniref:Uncharacterized protein n=1 Tax=Galerina marginata (strain CBS 339.88) TaxID=685588 RepID=A0A067T0Q5_GALM3|nr:hypothetical protein GALMADRAFT_139661 [Galerina marginata CBS 339.88]
MESDTQVRIYDPAHAIGDVKGYLNGDERRDQTTSQRFSHPSISSKERSSPSQSLMSNPSFGEAIPMTIYLLTLCQRLTTITPHAVCSEGPGSYGPPKHRDWDQQQGGRRCADVFVKFYSCINICDDFSLYLNIPFTAKRVSYLQLVPLELRAPPKPTCHYRRRHSRRAHPHPSRAYFYAGPAAQGLAEPPHISERRAAQPWLVIQSLPNHPPARRHGEEYNQDVELGLAASGVLRPFGSGDIALSPRPLLNRSSAQAQVIRPITTLTARPSLEIAALRTRRQQLLAYRIQMLQRQIKDAQKEQGNVIEANSGLEDDAQ